MIKWGEYLIIKMKQYKQVTPLDDESLTPWNH